MRRSWRLAVALLAMIVSPAFAADMPLKAPAAVPVALGWNGAYVGFQVGGEWANTNWDPTCIDSGGPPLGTCGSAASLLAFPGAPDSNARFSTHGLRYGLYWGWMFQPTERIVLGAESDWAHHSNTASVPFIVGCATAACTGGAFGPGPFTGDSTTVRLGDDYSLRVRAGFLVMPNLQLYGTGGVAAQRVETTEVCNGNTGAGACTFGVLTDAQSRTMVGYTVGVGLEWKMLDHILLRGEYRFNDYGTIKHSAFLNSGQFEEFSNIHVKTQMATFGIAYLFDPPRW
jgi:outer membrane immunogenic protein